jgi:O-antigen/teichoic acid export membrane protein
MLFPYFRNYENNHHGFFPLALLVSLSGLVLAMILLLLFKPLILEKGGDHPALFVSYFYYIIPLLFFTLAFLILDNYYKVLYNAVQGTFLKDFLQRLLILTGALLFLFNLISFETFVWIFLLAFFVPTIVLFAMLYREKQISLKRAPGFVSKDLRKKMIEVSFFGILTSFSGLLVLNIDSIMINAILDLSNTGIYAITFFFGTVILIPSRSLLKISSVVIADSWKKKDISTINTIYYKSCLNQMILASLLFIGIWANIHNIFRILPPEYEAGKYVIFFISLSAVIQMAGGTSNMILFTSPRYRVHTWFMLVLVVLLILLVSIIPAVIVYRRKERMAARQRVSQ